MNCGYFPEAKSAEMWKVEESGCKRLILSVTPLLLTWRSQSHMMGAKHVNMHYKLPT